MAYYGIRCACYLSWIAVCNHLRQWFLVFVFIEAVTNAGCFIQACCAILFLVKLALLPAISAPDNDRASILAFQICFFRALHAFIVFIQCSSFVIMETSVRLHRFRLLYLDSYSSVVQHRFEFFNVYQAVETSLVI